MKKDNMEIIFREPAETSMSECLNNGHKLTETTGTSAWKVPIRHVI